MDGHEDLRQLRLKSIQRCIQSLVHACQCKDANCRLSSCQKMKRVVSHTRICRKKANGVCPICKQMIALCLYHAKHCIENMCRVPFCLQIKLRQQEWNQRATPALELVAKQKGQPIEGVSRWLQCRCHILRSDQKMELDETQHKK